MTTIHSTSRLNVEATINSWLRADLAAVTKPSWLASYTFQTEIPEEGITPPAISCIHLPGIDRELWQGRNVGDGLKGVQAYGIADVSCWVSRNTSTGAHNGNWMSQLRTLGDMVEHVAVRNATRIIKDYYTSQSSPPDTLFRVVIWRIENVAVTPEANPDIQRSRKLITYFWTLRTS